MRHHWHFLSRRVRSSILVPTMIILLLGLPSTQIISAFSKFQPSSTPTQGKSTTISRRSLIKNLPVVATTASTASTVLSKPASAAFFGENKERRQLELCLVNVLRVKYWAMILAEKLRDEQATRDQTLSAYLEARLAAKAMVSKKVGGGANANVYMLGGLQIKECLADLKWYSKTRKMDQLNDDLLESLASIVEFDGLESVKDPSPRSSLTLSQFSDQKSRYVSRMLSERVSPLAEEVVTLFGPDARATSESYIRQYYSNELPLERHSTTETKQEYTTI